LHSAASQTSADDSSVPPIYPAMAKSQHVAGDVRVDALVDANGRVITMKLSLARLCCTRRPWTPCANGSISRHLKRQACLDAPYVTIQFRLQ